MNSLHVESEQSPIEWQVLEESGIPSDLHSPAKHPAHPWHHELKLATGGLLCAILIMGVGTSYMNKKIVHSLREKDLQISSLIEEVGQIQAENLSLSLQAQESEAQLEAMEAEMLEVQTQVKAVDENGGVFGLQNQVTSLTSKIQSQNVALGSLLKAGMTLSTISTVAEDETLDILILGTHGRLTDTIMLASINTKTQKVNLLSIPRDLAVNGRRVNEYWSKFGIDSMRTEIQKVTGLYPEKYMVVDMKSFETFIDALGGIDVSVEKDLYDSLYPGPNFTYETFSVPAGTHHFDGVTALKYARSRKSTTDFDRAKRQQEIVQAVKNKILSMNPLQNVDQWVPIYDSISGSIQTDLDLWTLMAYLKDYSQYEIKTGHVLSTSNYLYSTTGTNGAYLLIPKAGNYEEIKKYIADLVTQ